MNGQRLNAFPQGQVYFWLQISRSRGDESAKLGAHSLPGWGGQKSNLSLSTGRRWGLGSHQDHNSEEVILHKEIQVLQGRGPDTKWQKIHIVLLYSNSQAFSLLFHTISQYFKNIFDNSKYLEVLIMNIDIIKQSMAPLNCIVEYS